MAPHNNQLTMMDNILRGAIGKQEAMKRNIHENHSLSMASATRLQEVEDILVKMAKDGVIGEEEVRKFVDKQRKRLVEIAAKNVENERDVDSFVAAATQLRQQELLDVQQQQQQDGDAGVGGSGIATKDYDTILQDLYEKDRASRSAAERTADGGKYVREIRNELNEEVLDGGDGGAMDEDEDIVCMNNTLASQAQGNLKCPITGEFLVLSSREFPADNFSQSSSSGSCRCSFFVLRL